MNYLIVGDVHGCYHTFKNMLEKHWNQENEMLIQLGDLIDRGLHSPKMVQFARELRELYPESVLFLKGNHEFEFIEHFTNGPNKNWLRQCGELTLKLYADEKRDCLDDVKWMKSLPLFWENEHIYISHAGISESAVDPFFEDGEYSVLWNRSPLKNINKLQVIGHTPCKEPAYNEDSNAWNIDTGAAYSGFLTGIKLSEDGSVIEIHKEKTDQRDLPSNF